MNTGLVSIIVPIYGVEKYIENCLHSLFKQTYSNIQYVFINDCTKDRSIEVLESIMSIYPEREKNCTIINHNINKGLAAARKTGINNSNGEYIMHVDSDDYLELDAVERLINAARIANADIVMGGSFVVSGKTKVQSPCIPKLSKEELINGMLTRKILPSIWGKLYSRYLYEGNKDVQHIEGLDYGEDYVTVPRLIYYARKVAYVEAPLYNYVIYNSSSYTSNFTSKSMNNLIQADNKLFEFFNGIVSDDILIMSKLRTELYMLKCCNISLFENIKNIYYELSMKNKSLLPIKDRVLLFLVNNDLYRIAIIYIKAGISLVKYLR